MWLSSKENILFRLTNEYMQKSVENTMTVLEYLNGLNSGFYENVDYILQKLDDSYNIYDAYGFSKIHYGLIVGEIIFFDVFKGIECKQDHHIEYNNAIFRKKDGSHFYGEFCGGKADSDGYFAWDDPIEAYQNSFDGEKIETKIVSIKPKNLPLEVGFTTVATTLKHINLRGGVARMPYKSKTVRVFVKNDEDHHVLSSVNAVHKLKR